MGAEDTIAAAQAGDLAAFLQQARLEQYLAPLTALGAAEPRDLNDLGQEDFDSMGMKKLEMNRLKAALQGS